MKIRWEENHCIIEGLTPEALNAEDRGIAEQVGTLLQQQINQLQEQLNNLQSLINSLRAESSRLSSITQSADGKVGIGTTNPTRALTINSDSLFSKPLEVGSTALWFNNAVSYYSAGGSGLKIDTVENATSATCNLRLNSYDTNSLTQFNFDIGSLTNATNGVALRIFRANNTATINHSLTSNASSFLCNLIGNLGIGTNAPAEKLDINGVLRVRTQIKLGANDNVFAYGAVPTSGTWKMGDVRYNPNPAAGGFVGWVCVTAGTPGIWKAFGAIAA